MPMETRPPMIKGTTSQERLAHAAQIVHAACVGTVIDHANHREEKRCHDPVTNHLNAGARKPDEVIVAKPIDTRPM